ncbi:MAG: gliding motility-associated C-terminal domain-containing protein [Bacteroidota bacterium]
MKKFTLLFTCLCLLFTAARSQDDVGVTAITAPVSGCALSSTEAVTISIFNFGTTDLTGVPFTVQFSVNGSPSMFETVSFTPFLPNSTVSYTFVQTANLSTAGTYTLTATTNLGSDANNANDAVTGYLVTSSALSVGGSVTASATVCSGSNSGTLTLAGHTGNVLQWEQSTDGGFTWIPIVNTTTTQSYNNLTTTTMYRAVVQSGACPFATSSAATITVDPVSAGGSVTSNASVCSGSNSGTLNLSGHTGNVLNWQQSTDGGFTWTNIANTTTSQTYLNLTTTTMYRAVVQSGVCATANSSAATITVDPVTVGGSVSSNALVCEGSNSGTLTLSGHTGSVLNWEFSTDGGSTWNNIVNTTTSHAYNNLVVTTMFRAVVQSGTCSAVPSGSATITVSPATVDGSVTPDATVCTGSNSGTLTLSGHTGSVLNWQQSTDGGFTWTNIANTTTTQTYLNLTTTTMYRAVVQSGACPSDASSPATITVTPLTVGGTVNSNMTVCAPTNTGTLNLTGHTGSVIRWEYSTDGGFTWIPITNTTTSHTFNNLTVTTRFRAVVQNGTCASANSAAAIVTVTPASVGGSVASNATVCAGSNSGTLTLSGHTGNVQNWQFSTNGGVTWNNIANTTTSQAYLNLTTTTMYRAVVRNGTCATANSSPATITVNPITVGGSVSPNATVCSGSNSGTLTLSGHTGSVIRWESSTDGGFTWTNISNTTTTQAYNNLTQTTMYRAVVQSGVCAPGNSAAATITVSPPSVGGSVASNATVCLGNNTGTLTLSGHTGSVTMWQFSTNGGATWNNIANTTTSHTYNNLTVNTMFRAVVQSGACASANSSAATITVVPAPTPGSVNSSATVCSGANSGTLTLTGNTGTVSSWELSTDGGFTWVSISNTTTSQAYSNITATTMYRARVTNGICPPVPSASATISVTPQSVGGTASSNATVCASANSGTITLSGYTGNVTSWEFSTDGGFTWNTIANTTPSQTYNNLTVTTWYRALVLSGVCAADTSNIVVITVDPATAGGTLSANATVCSGANTGTINLSGQVGNVIRWELSTDMGSTWVPFANTATSYTYNNLTTTTLYRVYVQSGVCAAMYSTNDTIFVDQQSAGGSLASSATVCSGTNSGTLVLNGYTGNINGWEFSTDGGFTWNPIANTTNTENYSALTTTTMYHVIVANGVCPADTSNNVTITVDPVSVGGTLAPNDTVCAGANSGVINLTGQTGSVLNWEFSTDMGSTWVPFSNTTTSYNYTNLTTTTLYRAYVQSGVCPAVYSSVDTIMVSPQTVAGTLSSDATVCASGNSGTVTLTGNVGNVTSWEFSTDGGFTWNTIVNTTTSQVYTNLTVTTMYRALVLSGVCLADTSNIVTITVDPITVGGTLSPNDTVCAGANSGTITLSGQVGAVLNWEYSTDMGSTWIPFANTTTSYNYTNLTTTTLYRAYVQSGVCAPMYSTTDTIRVDAVSDAGVILSNMTVCETDNNGVLVLSGYTGTILDWLTSTNGGMTWTPSGNTNDSMAYSALTDTTWYIAVAQSGVCPSDTSAVTTIIVHAKPVASFVSSNVCDGNAVSFNNTTTIAAGSISSNFWDFGDGNNALAVSPAYTYADTGTYAVTLYVESNNGCRDTAYGSVTVYPLPDATISPSGSTTFCADDSVTLMAPAGVDDIYLWSTGDTTQSIVVNTSGWYVLTVTDTITGCMKMDSVQITVFPLPAVSASASDTAISVGTVVTLTASEGVSYSWLPLVVTNPFAQITEAAPTVSTNFTVYVTDDNGCMNRDSVYVTVNYDYDITISNLMTPNGDGFNDNFYIENILYYPENTLVIYNRNGQEVYTKQGYNNSWDGTRNGQLLPDGTYYYVLKFTDTEFIFKGSITILHE